ncbi:MAG: hypothetical protein ACI82A_000382 [Candidatus Azotimanducaceae bacterium]|jgi:hypothetical protein
MNTFKKIALTTAIASSLFAGQAFAADQGTLGTDSTGKSVVSLTINDQVQITGVDDIALGAFDGTNDLTGATAFCVYRSGAGDYQMTVSADGKTAFEVASATTGDTIGFTTKVDGDADASNGAAIAHAATSGAYTGSNAIDCGSSDNAALEVNFAAADLRTAGSATDYTATVVILVEPI